MTDRKINLKGFGTSDDDGKPAIIVESVLDPNQVAGRFNIGFGAAERDNEIWFVVLSHDQQVLAGTPNNESIREFVRELLDYEEYYLLVDHVTDIVSDDPWYSFDSFGVVEDDSFMYRETADVGDGFSDQIRSVKNSLENDATDS